MTSRKMTCVLTAAAGIALGSVAFAADPADRDRPAAAGQPQQQDRQQNAGQQNDAQQQINQLLAQIAADPKTAADKLFILTAALHNQSEIELARQIAGKTQNEQVKKMAQQMLQSLQKTHDQLQQTARAIGLQIPQEL